MSVYRQPQGHEAAQRGQGGMEAGIARASKTPVLDKVDTPEDLRALPESEMQQLAAELRQELI
jgi:hypothetical protein